MKKRSVNRDTYREIERSIINEDREFYEELMIFKGDISNAAEHQAWVDWASDMIMERFGIDYNEAVGRLSIIEDYFNNYI